jgi:hypothetical protein
MHLALVDTVNLAKFAKAADGVKDFVKKSEERLLV